MTIKLKCYGGKFIELTFEGWGTPMTEDVTNFQGIVDTGLINNLRNIADELEEHNEKMKKQ